MQYLRSYQFAFDSPNGLVNMLLGLLCQFIPVIGPLTFMGYQYEVVEELHLSRGGRYPDFTFSRFTNYLVRGVWPFIIQLIATMPLVILFLVFWFSLLGLAAASANSPNPSPLLPFLFIGVFVVFFIVNILIMFVLVPLRLWAGLAQDFNLGKMWAFMREFFGLVLVDLLWCELFNVVASMAMMMVGLLMCFVGIYFTMTVVMFAQSHLVYQVYELYLERGGAAIPLKIEEGTRPT
jgi:hypothetical protein